MKKTTNKTEPKRFISILSDYGFKVTFGNESDTRFLKKAIQLLIKSPVPIKEVTFEKNEVPALTKNSRSGIFDLTCVDETGKVYIVEMQLNDFKHFIHRGKFYAFHRLNKMVQKGKYRFDDLEPIYIISFLAGNTFKTKEFHQIGMLKNQHGELMDDQIIHVVIELNKWNKTIAELESDFDKLLYIMKFTETATILEEIPKSLSSEEWIEAMIKELDKRNMPQDQLIAIEMALAREGSMLAAEEEKIKEIKKQAKKRLDFERKQAELKLAEEKKITEQKLTKVKKIAEQKLAKEKKLTEQKLVKAKKIAEQKLAKERKLTEQKLAKEKKLTEQKLVKAKKIAEQKLAEEKKLAEQKLTQSVKKLFLLGTISNEQIALILDLPIKKIQQLKKEFNKQQK